MTRQIPLFKVFMSPFAAGNVAETLASGFIAEGKRVAELEERFGAWLGRPAAMVSSCTAALHLALVMAGVKGGEVISTAMTAEPTNTAILQAGGEVVWADVDPLNGNVTPASVEELINARTRAIMVVHYGGVPVNLNAFRAISEHYGIPVIEDAAHALGAKYDGERIGANGDYVCFSFQAIKHLPMGDGGALVTADLQRAKTLRWFGIDRTANRTTVNISEAGYKYNLNDITASIGLAQMGHVDDIIARHIANGKYYDVALQDIPGLTLCQWDEKAEPSYWFYTILAERRDDLSRMLTEKGIGNSQAHKRNDWHGVFAASRKELPGLDSFYSKMLHIPCHWAVSHEDRAYIVDTLRGGW